MERNSNSIVGYRVVTTEGEIGKVDEFYFDDETWTIRYVIVKMEEGLAGRKVLITTGSLVKDHREPGVFFVPYTKDQIMSSPVIDTDNPVSRQQENDLYWHYGGNRYWEGGLCAGGLRSSRSVTSFHVHAMDGECGCICDFILDDETWKLRCLVLETQPSPGGKKVLIPLGHILEMGWDDAGLYLDETVADLEKSEVFEAARFADLPVVSGVVS
jgi:sporulation protein YlmC with PRC-barrel domain